MLISLESQLTGRPKEQVLEATLAAAQDSKYEGNRAAVLMMLAPQLRGDLLIPALAMAQAIEDERARAETLTRFAPRLTGELKEQVLEAALAAAQGIKSEISRAVVLSSLASQLTNRTQRDMVLYNMAEITFASFRQSPRDELLQYFLPLHECVSTLLGPDAAAMIVSNSLDVIRDWQWL